MCSSQSVSAVEPESGANLGFSASRLMNSPPHWDELSFFFKNNVAYLFFGFVGSLLLRGRFSSGGEPGLLSGGV